MKLIWGTIIFLLGVCLGFGMKQPEVITKIEVRKEIVREMPEGFQPGKFANEYMNGEIQKKRAELEKEYSDKIKEIALQTEERKNRDNLYLEGFKEGVKRAKEYR